MLLLDSGFAMTETAHVVKLPAGDGRCLLLAATREAGTPI